MGGQRVCKLAIAISRSARSFERASRAGNCDCEFTYTLASHPNGRLWETKKKPYNYRLKPKYQDLLANTLIISNTLEGKERQERHILTDQDHRGDHALRESNGSINQDTARRERNFSLVL